MLCRIKRKDIISMTDTQINQNLKIIGKNENSCQYRDEHMDFFVCFKTFFKD